MKKRTVVPCTKCKKKMYCVPCIKQWWGILYTFKFSVKRSLYFRKPIFNHSILAECCVYRYPHLKEEEISELCPFCRRNCNCNACLHSNGMIKVWLLSYWTVNALNLLPLTKQPEFFVFLTFRLQRGTSLIVKRSRIFSIYFILCAHI